MAGIRKDHGLSEWERKSWTAHEGEESGGRDGWKFCSYSDSDGVR